MDSITVTVSIDTEEDNWGSYARAGATTENIGHLPALQDVLDRYGARPTYLVNSPPLRDADSLRVLGTLAERPSVEIGAHCHPWNSPPYDGGDDGESMMRALSMETNLRKIRRLTSRIESELGTRPTTFRSGRWSLGPSIARALAETGYRVDASVTPFMDWSRIGGPDYTRAPHLPYRFEPAAPMVPVDHGSLVEVPTTVGFLRGDPRRSARIRHRLERSVLAKLRVVGLIDRLGFLRRRWLSPERSSLDELVKLADACVSNGQRCLDFTFHSACLLPGATPYVQDDDDRSKFLRDIEAFLRHCAGRSWTFATLGEVGESVLGDPTSATSTGSRG